ncbi:lipopolysaccharide biosynthesis protein [Cohnella yongneupensis]|uniref:Lipopolysaccharide biosynthesis protein n=1 Tax=Cohnella yongneupensis TaxID=425006 RepID=A0ABW0R6Q0_9BACL
MHRTKKSVYNIVSMLSSTVINSVMGLIVVNLTIRTYGSDMNGFSATVAQFMVFLTIIEGGFGMATNVALYKPFVESDRQKINAILSASRIVYLILSGVFTVIALGIAIFYPYFVKSDLNVGLMTTFFLMAIFPAAISFLTEKYRVLFEVSQREYILYSVSAVVTFLTHLSSILIMLSGGGILWVRFSIMCFGLSMSLILILLFRKYFSRVSFRAKPDFSGLKSTPNVMVQKLANALYISLPTLVISSFVGTVYASVFMIYNSIFAVVKNVITSFVSAPINGFGQLLAEKGPEGVRSIFRTFEFITVLVLNTLITTTIVFIVPFIRIYTHGVNDINYVDWNMAVLFMIVVIFEVIFLPSSIILNVSGRFKASRDIHVVSCAILCVSSLTLVHFYGVYGVLIGNLLCNIVRAQLAIQYTHHRILQMDSGAYYRVLFFNSALSFLISFAGYRLDLNFGGYVPLLLAGAAGFVAIGAIVAVMNYLFFKREMVEAFDRFAGITFRKLRRAI